MSLSVEHEMNERLQGCDLEQNLDSGAAQTSRLTPERESHEGDINAATDDTKSTETSSPSALHSGHDISHHDDRPNSACSPLSPGTMGSESPVLEKGHAQRLVKTQQGQERPAFLLNWWLETAACFASVAALIALCGTLCAYRHKPSPHWPTWLSLNTIVAIYIVVLKTAVVLIAAEGLGQLKWAWLTKERPLTDIVKYDDATRGPVGALVLLWRVRNHSVLASCGSLITILALAVDPLAQQIIHYYDCSVPVNSQSMTLPRTNWYQDRIIGDILGTEQATVSAGVQKAFRLGTFASGSVEVKGCSTGNCHSHSEYSTVGWCSKCEDITDSITFECHPIGSCNGSVVSFDTRLTTSIPHGGLSIDVDKYGDGITPYAAIGLSPGAFIYHVSFDFVKARQWRQSVDLGKPYPGCQTEYGKTSWKCRGYGAARCRLFPCVKSYTASVRAGTVSETLIDVATD